jgi:uncharacterized DUF497 family protein
MPLSFEWDEKKARSNARKHGIAFDEASTVFADALSLTIRDPAHSQMEERFVTLGTSHSGKLLVVVHTKGATISASLALARRADANDEPMKKGNKNNDSEMQAEYDFSPGVRGKYARRYAQGTNVVVLDPDVAKLFPNAEAVNKSLRSLAKTIRRRKSVVAK